MKKFLKLGCFGLIGLFTIVIIALIIDIGNDDEQASNQPKEENVEKKETKSEETAKEETNKKADVITDDVYTNEIGPEINEITKEFDSIWTENWQSSWKKISTANGQPDIVSLKDDMEIVSEKYSELSKRISAIDSKSNKPEYQEQLEEYRVNMSLATNYRGNAANAILQAINGVADLESRMEEAKKSVELADEKMLTALVAITSIDSKLGLIEEKEK
ncbi:ribonuclease [Cytobacillus oceanisediminis]|uniref:ribonuclease n=1 Tax=Cytobacillus oceanisediminis TaxID=665099 RepID=UPI001863AB27|nr:ribonuclease [Cytobacillus oceanisediminis]QOK27646.1 ribonuclease [Cytobacillus oceanisediminis]